MSLFYGLSVYPCSRRYWMGGVGALAMAWVSRGQARTLPRLITVGGALTEIVFALGAQEYLVGVDSTSYYPNEAQKLPRVGYMRQLSAEGILSLRPDVLVATSEAGPPAVLRQLGEAGLQLHIVPVTHDWDEVQRKIDTIGKATQRTLQARALQQQIETQRFWLQSRIKANGGGPKAFFIMAHAGSPMVAGRQTAANAVLRMMGVRNAAEGYEGYRPLSAEALAVLRPDFIVTTTQSLDAMGGESVFWQQPQWRLWPPARRRLWHEDALALLGFGPRLPEVVERGAKAFGTWRAT